MTLFEQMVEELRINSNARADNAIHEVMQQIALAGLSRRPLDTREGDCRF